jgi:3-oxoacyl-[acyl-carrier-protein] synthase II
LAGAGENLIPDVVLGLLNELSPISRLRYSPFDPKSTGCFIASGSGIAVLENKNYALKRNAEIYAQVESYLVTTVKNCLFNYKSDLIEAVEKAILLALQKADITSRDIDMVIPTADGSYTSNRYELKAIKKIFKNKQQFVYSPKPNIGHMLSVSGVVDLFVASMAIKTNMIPPLYSSNQIDNGVFNEMFVKEKPIERPINRVLLLQRDIIGGRLGVMIIKRYKK